MQTRCDVVGGWRMFARTWVGNGAGKIPVVLVHGLSMSSLYMAPTGEALSPDYDVYAPDLPGYGRSEKVIKPLDFSGLAYTLRGWMDFMGIERAVLLGNSMGCQTIIEFALQSPQRVEKIVLVGPTIDPNSRSYWRTISRGLFHLLFEPPSFYLVILRDYFSHGIRQTFMSLGFALRDPLEARLPNVTAPTLVVRGSQDRIVSQEWAETVARALPNGRQITIPEAGHVVNFDSPDKLVKVVRPFIET